MSARWWTFVTWGLVAASAVFWGLKLFVKPPPVPVGTPVAMNAAAVRGDLTRLLGVDAPPPVAAEAAAPPPDSRFQLIGVLAAKPRAAAREGVALIAVDGKPARAYRVGAVVDGQLVVKSVAALGVTLGPRDGAALVSLNLQPMAPAATGTLPGVNDGEANMSAPQPLQGVPTGPAQPLQQQQLQQMQQLQMQQMQQLQMQQRRVVPPPQQQQPFDPGNPGEGPGQTNNQGLQTR
jgi:general secretion pathway protein C